MRLVRRAGPFGIGSDDTRCVVEVTAEVTDCRDPKDNMFLELAVNGRASHIITGSMARITMYIGRMLK